MSFRYRYFGAFRLLLSLMVVFQHFTGNAAPPSFTARWEVYEFGSLAVLVFFCMSGFVIAEAVDMAYRSRPQAFLVNRMLRLAPHLVVANAITIVLTWIYVQRGTFHVERFGEQPPPGAFSVANIVGNLLGFIPYSPHLTRYNFIQFTWALRTEATFYLVVFVALLVSARWMRGKVEFGVVLSWIFVLMLPGALLSLAGYGFKTFGFVSYFAFGVGLYFAMKGSWFGGFTAAVSFIILMVRFFQQSPLHSDLGFHRAVSAQACVLVGLLLVMIVLAGLKMDRWRRVDSYLGAITYPIYVYHFVILVVVTSAFPTYRYRWFVGGIVLSIIFPALMAEILDPQINRLRDRVRGKRLSTSGGVQLG